MKPPKTISQHSLERLQAVKTYIGQHYHEEMRLAHLADIQGISPVAFSRLFSRQTGQCVSQHIIQVRIEHCQQLLRDTDMSVSDIAFSCGFNTLSFFNRSFLRQCGCTPTEYREKARRKRQTR